MMRSWLSTLIPPPTNNNTTSTLPPIHHLLMDGLAKSTPTGATPIPTAPPQTLCPQKHPRLSRHPSTTLLTSSHTSNGPTTTRQTMHPVVSSIQKNTIHVHPSITSHPPAYLQNQIDSPMYYIGLSLYPGAKDTIRVLCRSWRSELFVVTCCAHVIVFIFASLSLSHTNDSDVQSCF